MITKFLTVAKVSKSVFTEKRSKFIAYIFPIKSEEEVRINLLSLKKEYYDARHICWAYVLGEERSNFRFNDDGEPSGTAGKPILGQINSNELTNVLVAVVRYFGGIKLGTGGLAAAYKEAVALSISEAIIIEEIVKESLIFSFDYLSMNSVMKCIKDYETEIVSQEFNLSCYIHLKIPREFYSSIFQRLEKIESLKFLTEDEI